MEGGHRILYSDFMMGLTRARMLELFWLARKWTVAHVVDAMSQGFYDYDLHL